MLLTINLLSLSSLFALIYLIGPVSSREFVPKVKQELQNYFTDLSQRSILLTFMAINRQTNRNKHNETYQDNYIDKFAESLGIGKQDFSGFFDKDILGSEELAITKKYFKQFSNSKIADKLTYAMTSFTMNPKTREDASYIKDGFDSLLKNHDIRLSLLKDELEHYNTALSKDAGKYKIFMNYAFEFFSHIDSFKRICTNKYANQFIWVRNNILPWMRNFQPCTPIKFDVDYLIELCQNNFKNPKPLLHPKLDSLKKNAFNSPYYEKIWYNEGTLISTLDEIFAQNSNKGRSWRDSPMEKMLLAIYFFMFGPFADEEKLKTHRKGQLFDFNKKPEEYSLDSEAPKRVPEPETIHKTSEPSRKTSETNYKTPEVNHKTSEPVHKTPEKISDAPESIHRLPETDNKNPETVDKTSETIDETPEMVVQQPQEGSEKVSETEESNYEFLKRKLTGLFYNKSKNDQPETSATDLSPNLDETKKASNEEKNADSKLSTQQENVVKIDVHINNDQNIPISQETDAFPKEEQSSNSKLEPQQKNSAEAEMPIENNHNNQSPHQPEKILKKEISTDSKLSPQQVNSVKHEVQNGQKARPPYEIDPLSKEEASIDTKLKPPEEKKTKKKRRKKKKKKSSKQEVRIDDGQDNPSLHKSNEPLKGEKTSEPEVRIHEYNDDLPHNNNDVKDEAKEQPQEEKTNEPEVLIGNPDNRSPHETDEEWEDAEGTWKEEKTSEPETNSSDNHGNLPNNDKDDRTLREEEKANTDSNFEPSKEKPSQPEVKRDNDHHNLSGYGTGEVPKEEPNSDSKLKPPEEESSKPEVQREDDHHNLFDHTSVDDDKTNEFPIEERVNPPEVSVSNEHDNLSHQSKREVDREDSYSMQKPQSQKAFQPEVKTNQPEVKLTKLDVDGEDSYSEVELSTKETVELNVQTIKPEVNSGASKKKISWVLFVIGFLGIAAASTIGYFVFNLIFPKSDVVASGPHNILGVSDQNQSTGRGELIILVFVLVMILAICEYRIYFVQQKFAQQEKVESQATVVKKEFTLTGSTLKKDISKNQTSTSQKDQTSIT